jgi:hypothetical protein
MVRKGSQLTSLGGMVPSAGQALSAYPANWKEKITLKKGNAVKIFLPMIDCFQQNIRSTHFLALPYLPCVGSTGDKL